MKTKNKKLQLKAIRETEGNPNVMSDEVFGGLVDSMRKKGWYMEPSTVWEYEPEKYRAISGHKRIQAGIEAGILDATFRVICDPGYTEAQARLDLMEANHRHGEDDEDLAKRFIGSMIDKLDIDIDKIIESTGISDEKIQELLGFNDFEENKKDDDIPDVEKTNVRIGDIYQLGDHRIMCGDSTKFEDVKKLMNGENADMVFTDPPYDLKNYDWLQYLLSNKIFILGTDTQQIEYVNRIKNFRGFFIMPIIPPALRALNVNMPRIGHDLISFFCKGKIGYKNTNDGFSTMLDTELAKNRLAAAREGRHGLEKSVLVPCKFLIHYTKKSNIIQDLFLGSGTTLIACEKTGRICYGMEIEPLYIQVIIDRWEKFTNKRVDKI